MQEVILAQTLSRAAPGLVADTLIDVALVAALVVSAVTDLHNRTIYNAVTYPCFVGGVLLNALSGGVAAAFDAILACAVALLIVGPLVWARAMGAGDLKLLLAVAALGRTRFFLWSLGYTAIAGGLLAVISVTLRGRWRHTAGRLVRLCTRPRHFAREEVQARRFEDYLPYGVAIAAGTGYALCHKWLGTLGR
jgi:prepilin peptidase CpaA